MLVFCKFKSSERRRTSTFEYCLPQCFIVSGIEVAMNDKAVRLCFFERKQILSTMPLGRATTLIKFFRWIARKHLEYLYEHLRFDAHIKREKNAVCIRFTTSTCKVSDILKKSFIRLCAEINPWSNRLKLASHLLQMPRLRISSECAVFTVQSHDCTIHREALIALRDGLNVPDIRWEHVVSALTRLVTTTGYQFSR